MFCTFSETEGEVGPVKQVKAPPPPVIITDRSKAVVLLWFSVACFGVRVSVTFLLMFVYIIFSLVWVDECPPLGKSWSLG